MRRIGGSSLLRATRLTLVGICSFAFGAAVNAYAQSTPLSELWRQWEVVHNEWLVERAAYLQDRETHTKRLGP